MLEGNGAVAINNLMEDLATAEISAAQLKNWKTHNVLLDYNDRFDTVFSNILNEVKVELNKESEVSYAKHHFDSAVEILNNYLNGNYMFLGDAAGKKLNKKTDFESVVLMMKYCIY